MKNPLISTTGRHYKVGGTVAQPKIETIDHTKAIVLLSRVKRQGIYRPYIPHVVETLMKLKDDQHIVFHIPQINGKDRIFTGKHLMSVINYGLMKSKIDHRLRFVQDENVLVSEPVKWA